jgi:hypothetical protein
MTNRRLRRNSAAGGAFASDIRLVEHGPDAALVREIRKASNVDGFLDLRRSVVVARKRSS